ncbi:MAG: hypothetical protein F6J87_16535 [Spirulina sp. SIO3F2]|nr:hypothetical protein [Spirulina sp. SIO3F2]
MESNESKPDSFSLDERGFQLSAYRDSSAFMDWYDFTLANNSEDLGQIGGSPLDRFSQRLLEIADTHSGKPLCSIQKAKYKNIVGGDGTEYLGFIVFSGYNTLYFFRKKFGAEHVVLADSSGALLTHQELGAGTLRRWRSLLYELGLV